MWGLVSSCLNYHKLLLDAIDYSLLCLQGARDLAKPPTLTEIFQGHLKDSESKAEDSEKDQIEAELRKGLKRKFDRAHSSEAEEEESQKANDEQILKDGKLKKAKNVGSSFSSLSCLNNTKLILFFFL